MYQSAPGQIRTADTRFRRLTEVAFGVPRRAFPLVRDCQWLLPLHAV